MVVRELDRRLGLGKFQERALRTETSTSSGSMILPTTVHAVVGDRGVEESWLSMHSLYTRRLLESPQQDFGPGLHTFRQLPRKNDCVRLWRATGANARIHLDSNMLPAMETLD